MRFTRAQLKRIIQEELGRILNEQGADLEPRVDTEEPWGQQATRTGAAPVMGRQAPGPRATGNLPQRGTTTRPRFGSSGVTGNVTLPHYEPLGPSMEGGYTPDPEGGVSQASPEQLAAMDRGQTKRQGGQAAAGVAGAAQQAAERPRSRGGSERRAARRSAAEEAGVVPQGMSAREFLRTPEGRAWEPGGTVSPGVAPERVADRPQRAPAGTAQGAWSRRAGGGSAPPSGEQLTTAPAGTTQTRPLRRPAPPDETQTAIAALEEKQRKGTPLLREMIDRLADWSSD